MMSANCAYFKNEQARVEMQGLGFRVEGLGFRAPGLGCRAQG